MSSKIEDVQEPPLATFGGASLGQPVFMTPRERTAALVVSYMPNHDVLGSLLRSLSSQVDVLVLIDNGGGEQVAKTVRAQGVLMDCIRCEGNLGLGHALNRGFRYALEVGATHVATFDQDSDPASDLIARLMDAHRKLGFAGERCAAVGPAFFDVRKDEMTFFPFYRTEGGVIQTLQPAQPGTADLVEVDMLITSGMLINAAAWADGIRYDEALFVDHTDTEWCFRARSCGYKLFGCTSIHMGHALSDAPPKVFMGLSFFRYSPLRRYYYYRNTTYLCSDSVVPRVWRHRFAKGLIVRLAGNWMVDDRKFQSLKMMVRGAWDGWRGRMGKWQR